MSRTRTTARSGSRSRNDGELQGRVAEMESLYNAGQYARTIAVGEPMTGLLTSPRLRGQARLRVAQAYLQLGKSEPAKGPLAEARRDFETIKETEMTVECMAAEASIACFEQRPEAQGLAAAALRACRALRESPTALELQILSTLASSQMLVGQPIEAIRTFEEAIERADPVVDMRRLGKVLGNAAVAYRDLGQLEKAVKYSTRAVALFRTLQDLVSLAREENNLGCYLIRRGDLASARSHLERSMQLFEQTNLESARGLLLLSLCELCLAEGNLEQALAYANAAVEAGETQREMWSIANARMWKGRIAARLGDDASADNEFRIAKDILETSDMPERLAGCCVAYADVLEMRGDLARAYENLKLAFRVKAQPHG